VEGFSTPQKRSDRVVLEAYTAYWDTNRLPRLKRIIFDNTLSQQEALERVKTTEGHVDLVTGLSPLETLRVAQSAFATVVKKRASLTTIFGQFNLRKNASPWHDLRLRQAANMAINRAHLIQYAAKGNGVVIPALIPPQGFGFDPTLAPYPFAPDKARQLLREIGHGDGLAMTLIAPDALATQATVVSKMLEQTGFQVDLQILDAVTHSKQTSVTASEQSGEQPTWDFVTAPEQPGEPPTWDIALTHTNGWHNFPLFQIYQSYALGGPYDWGSEQPELRRLSEHVLGTIDREQQHGFLQQMERYTHTQALFLFLYNPIQLYAMNKAVAFVPYQSGILNLAETSVMAEHWSVRKQKAAMPE
jgi:ABC-type transport system substrate-binding protein